MFVEVGPGTAVSGRARLGDLPATTAARASATDDDWPEAYARLEQWVPANGYRRAGPKRELQTTDSFTGACRLEILVPVEA